MEVGGAHKSPEWLAGADQMLLTEQKGSKPSPFDTAPLASFTPDTGVCDRVVPQGDGDVDCGDDPWLEDKKGGDQILDQESHELGAGALLELRLIPSWW